MPSFRVKYGFKGKPPALYRAIVLLGVANFVAFVALDETRALWRSQSTPFAMKVAAALSWYADQGMAIHFAILGVGFVATFLFYRDRMVRVPAAPTIGAGPVSLFEVVIAATLAPAACGFVGALVAGALFAEVDRVWGVGIAVLVVLAAVWATDRLVFSFPQSERFRKGRTAIWIWAAMVSTLAMVFVMSDFG
jgi:hypothetical protein